jgi:hypothetical protein
MDLKRGALCVEFSCDVGVGLAAENTQQFYPQHNANKQPTNMFEKIGENKSKILRYLEDYLPTRVLNIFELNLQCMSSMHARTLRSLHCGPTRRLPKLYEVDSS